MKEALKTIKEFCLTHKESVAVAESVTAGCIQTLLSTEKDAEKFFQGGITAYNTAQKTRHLNIEPINAFNCNAVGLNISIEMAKEVCHLFCSSIGIATTGYAAPFPEENIKKPFTFLAIVFKGEILLAQKVIAVSGNYGLPVQQEYAQKAIEFLAQKLTAIK